MNTWKQAAIAGLGVVLAATCTGCSHHNDAESRATVTVTESAPESPGLSPSSDGDAALSENTSNAEFQDGIKPLEDSAFSSWLQKGSINTTDGEQLSIISTESQYNPEQRISWAIIELEGGQWAPVFFQHGELLSFAPLYGEKPTVVRVNDTTAEVSGDAGTAQVSFDRGTLSVRGMDADVPQVDVRHLD